jgi:hypothetical protein
MEKRIVEGHHCHEILVLRVEGMRTQAACRIDCIAVYYIQHDHLYRLYRLHRNSGAIVVQQW